MTPAIGDGIDEAIALLFPHNRWWIAAIRHIPIPVIMTLLSLGSFARVCFKSAGALKSLKSSLRNQFNTSTINATSQWRGHRGGHLGQ